MKKLYRVVVTVSERQYADFLADSPEEAEEMAEELLAERLTRADSGFTFDERYRDYSVNTARELEGKDNG